MNTSQNLNQFGMKLIELLKRSGRMSVTQIAKKLKSSRQRVQGYMKDLESKRIIQYYPTIIDHARIGYSTVVYSNLRIDYNKLQNIVKSLLRTKEVVWFVKLLGHYDIGLITLCKNFEEFMEFKEKKLSKIPGVLEIDNYAVLKHYYLGVPIESESRTPPRKLSRLKLDDLDYQIIDILKTNARAMYTEISSKLSISPQLVSYRINQLIKKGIIRLFTVQVDFLKLGYVIAWMGVNVGLKRLDNIVSEILKLKGVNWVDEVTGRYDLSLYVVVESRFELRKIIQKLAKIEGIKGIETSIVLADYSKSYI